MTDDFAFSLIGGEQPILGYVSAKDKTALSGYNMVRGSKNVYRKLSGTIAVRTGLKRRGAADTTEADVKSSYEWPTSLDYTRVIRVANSKLEVESDIVTSGTFVWYTLQSSLTLTAFVFDTVWDNTLKKDFLVFVRGDSNLFRWDGGIGKIASTTATTIVLTATVASQGFNTSGGSVTVNGTTYTYSGSSASTLTGVSGDPTGEAVGSVVLSAVITNATTPASGFTNDFVKVNNNQVGVGSYTSRLFYISNNANYISYSQSTPRIPGEGEVVTMGSSGKGASVRAGKFVLFAGSADAHEVSFSQITVGSTLTEQTLVEKKTLDNLGSVLQHEFIDNVGDDIVYLDQNNQLRQYGTFENLNQPRFPILSLPVYDELKDEDFTGGHLRAIGGIIHITAPLSGRDYMHETRETLTATGGIATERFWHPPQVRNVSRFAVILGVVFGHSNANPQLYQIGDTLQWHDDSPSDEDIPYDCVLRMSYRSMQNRFKLQTFDKIAWEGYLSEGTPLNGKVRFDYQGSTSVQNKVINSIESPAAFFSGSNAPSMGDSSLGDNPLGDGLSEEANDQELLPKFKVITDVNPVNCFEYQLEAYSDEVNSRWEMLCLGTNAKEATQLATFIRK